MIKVLIVGSLLFVWVQSCFLGVILGQRASGNIRRICNGFASYEWRKNNKLDKGNALQP